MNLQELKSKIFEIVDPSNGQTIKENNALKHIGYDDEKDVVTLLVTMHKVGGNDETKFKRSLAKLIKIDEGHKGVKLEIEENRVFGSITKQPINFIGVISGKGGVGKSSVAANIAYRLMKKGYDVGIIDADIYGASLPTILEVPHANPHFTDDQKIIPLFKDNMEIISTEFFTDPSQPVIWRGGMLNSMLNHFFYDVKWRPDTKFIIIDFPPGTGDITLDIKNIVPQAKMILVTTPHPSASHVAVKAGHACRSLNHELLGVVENMSYYINPVNNQKDFIFGEGGGQEVARQLDTELIAQLPISRPKRHKDIFDIDELNGQIYDEIADFVILNSNLNK